MISWLTMGLILKTFNSQETYNEKDKKYDSALSESDRGLCEDYIAALSELHVAEIDFIYK